MGVVHHVRPSRVAVVLAAGLFVVVLAACGGDSATSGGDGPTTTVAEFAGLTRAEPIQVGAVTLPEVTTGTAGGPFAFKAAPGELLIVYFGYTSCPDVCPTTLANLRVAREELGPAAEGIDLAMVTVDPDRDTPEVLSGYLSSFADRYHALRTTDRAELQAAEDAFGASSSVTTTDDGEIEVAHSGTTYVVDDQGRVLVEWPFGVSADEMTSDLRLLLAGEAT